MKINYVRGLEEEGAKFWLRRIGWEPSEVAKKIARISDPKKTGYIADIGGGHGRESLWLAEQGFQSILIEPNKYSLKFAKEKTKHKKVSLHFINAALPFLPIRPEIVGLVDLYWVLHQISDEHQIDSLKEIRRILKSKGTLYSTTFRKWEGHEMPRNLHPIEKKEVFANIHKAAGFKPLIKVEERSDTTNSYEKYWYGEFQKPKI
jgi:ubiquinone/menaquinone biosynthesis C-methylase UbiE